MEAIVNFSVIGFVFVVVAFVEMFMHRKPLTKKEVDEYQSLLDTARAEYSRLGAIFPKYDAFTELMNQRKQAKGFILIFSGIIMALALIILAVVAELSLLNIGMLCASALILMLYGIIKMSGSKKMAIGLLAVVIILGTLGRFFLDKAMALSPYAYLYLCGLVFVLGIITLFPKHKKA